MKLLQSIAFKIWLYNLLWNFICPLIAVAATFGWGYLYFFKMHGENMWLLFGGVAVAAFSYRVMQFIMIGFMDDDVRKVFHTMKGYD